MHEISVLVHVHKCIIKAHVDASINIPVRVTQSVTCLIAERGVASTVPIRSNTFAEIDHLIISTAILLPSAYPRRVVVSYKREYVHEVLVNCLVQLADEISVARRTDRPDMTIAVDWEEPNQTK